MLLNVVIRAEEMHRGVRDNVKITLCYIQPQPSASRRTGIKQGAITFSFKLMITKK